MKSRCSNEESNQSCWILVDLTNSAVIRLYHLSVSPTTPTIKFRTDSQEGEFNSPRVHTRGPPLSYSPITSAPAPRTSPEDMIKFDGGREEFADREITGKMSSPRRPRPGTPTQLHSPCTRPRLQTDPAFRSRPSRHSHDHASLYVSGSPPPPFAIAYCHQPPPTPSVLHSHIFLVVYAISLPPPALQSRRWRGV